MVLHTRKIDNEREEKMEQNFSDRKNRSRKVYIFFNWNGEQCQRKWKTFWKLVKIATNCPSHIILIRNRLFDFDSVNIFNSLIEVLWIKEVIRFFLLVFFFHFPQVWPENKMILLINSQKIKPFPTNKHIISSIFRAGHTISISTFWDQNEWMWKMFECICSKSLSIIALNNTI